MKDEDENMKEIVADAYKHGMRIIGCGASKAEALADAEKRVGPLTEDPHIVKQCGIYTVWK